jgi:copper(I)-binding protein
MRAFFHPATCVALALAAAGCGKPGEVYADHGYVRLPAVKGNPAVAYFTLHGGKDAAVLLSVTSPAVIKAEMHESMSHGSMASMAPIAHVPLPADGTLEFRPGGKHVMLYTLNPSVEAGGTIPLVFTFANNDRVQINAPVIAAGDTPPKE